MGRLRDFFHWAVGEFTRAETTLLFDHVAATRLHALTLPRSIRNESVATLSQNTGPGLCSRKELKSSLDKEKRFWFLHLVPFSYAGEREESIQRMTTSLHSAKKSCRLPKTDTSISLAQSDTDTKGCHDSPQTGKTLALDKLVRLPFESHPTWTKLFVLNLCPRQATDSEPRGCVKIHAGRLVVERNHESKCEVPTTRDLIGSFQLDDLLSM